MMTRMFLALFFVMLGPAAQADWFWGQWRTPTKIITDTDKFFVQFQEGAINPQNCDMPGGGVVIRRTVVGDDYYKQLYTLFIAALVAQKRVELNVISDCSYGPNVATASIGS